MAVKKTIYISEEANKWLEQQVNQSAFIDKLILAEKNKNISFVSKDEVIKLIQEYVKVAPPIIKEEVISPNIKKAAGSLLKL